MSRIPYRLREGQRDLAMYRLVAAGWARPQPYNRVKLWRSCAAFWFQLPFVDSFVTL